MERFEARPSMRTIWELVLLLSLLTCAKLALSDSGTRQATPPTEVPAKAGVVEAKAQEKPRDSAPAFGTIRGRLVWGEAPIPARGVLVRQGEAQPDPGVCAKDGPLLDEKLSIDPATKGVRNAFAYLVDPVGKNDEAQRALVQKNPVVLLNVEGCLFVPHSLGMHEDQTLQIRTTDSIVHNPHFNVFHGEAFIHLITNKDPYSRKMTANKRVVHIDCDIHFWMRSNVMIFNHPFFAVTAEDGSFEIKGVPAAEQRLVLWQETIGYLAPGLGKGMPVKVKAGEVTDVGLIKMSTIKRRGGRDSR